MHPAPHSRYRAAHEIARITQEQRHPHFAGEHALGQSLSALALHNRPKAVVNAPIFPDRTPAVVETPAPTFNRASAYDANLVMREGQTVKVLRKVAALLGITGRSAMRKQELAMEVASQDTDAEEVQFMEDNAG